MKKTLPILAFLLYVCAGCIQDEPLSPFADIEEFSLPADVKMSDATINQTNITVFVRKGYDLTSVVPSGIKISEGATLEPPANAPRDFSQPVTYTVTAADGVHQRTYTIQSILSALYTYDFEEWKEDGSKVYETPVAYDTEGHPVALWASGNTGVFIYRIGVFKQPEDYPVHKTSNAADGSYAAEMITQVGPPAAFAGIIGRKIPVVAGSLFTGVFNASDVMKNPLYATQFGQPFYDKPVRFTGKYKYTAGTGDYINPEGEVVPGRKDSCGIYAVFYKSDDNLDRLDGTNVLTHPNVVALAMLPPEARAGSQGDGFVPFDLAFDYTGKEEVDFTKNDYKLGIVLTSSFYGDHYEGVIGSHLVVDDLEIRCTSNE